MKTTLRRRLRKIHIWLGLIIGLQLVIWTLSGVVMSILDINEVRGDHLVNKSKPVAIRQDQFLKTIDDLKLKLPNEFGEISDIRLTQILGKPVLSLKNYEEKGFLFDVTNKEIIRINENLVEKIARDHFRGDGKIESIKLLTKVNPVEYRSRLPVWQVIFNGPDNFNLYISPDDGRILARRSSTWRLYDFFWMLHIMDYSERDNFNNPVVRIASVIGTILAITGFSLLFFAIRRKRRA